MGSLGIVPNLGQIYNPDSFTGNGSNTTFTLTHLVTSDQSIIWVEGGVIQKPGIDFTISGLTLTRTTAPANLVACFAMYLGVSMDIGVPSDGTVTLAKMAVNSVDSDQYVDGSIDAVHMSANSIDSDSYVDGSIDEAHIANDAIDFAAHLKAGTDGELITWDSSGNAAAVPVGTDTHVLTSGGIGVAPTFQAAAAGGDTRNFIIDGDFTQWPEGTSFSSMGNATYTAALMDFRTSTTVAVFTGSRNTDVPTQAQSGHQSLYSYDLACTTIDASIAGSDLVSTWYYMTGPDFSPLHKKEFTLSFWVKATITGINCVSFSNNANNRWYCAEYTINSTLTWEKKTITITGDTGGTWLFDEANTGIHIVFSYLAGSSRHATGGVWSGTVAYATSNQVNNASSTSNIFRMSQLQLVLGSTSPNFLGESIATVVDQVDYYVQRFDYDTTAYETVAMGSTTSTTVYDLDMRLRRYMRKVPSVAFTAADTFNGVDNNNGSKVGTGITTFGIQQDRFTLRLTCGATGVVGAGAIRRDSSDTCNITVDARH